MKLFYAPNSRAETPLWILKVLNVPFDLATLDLNKGENRQDWFLKINPKGHVPVLQTEQETICETFAIAMYLADRFPKKQLAPPIGSPSRGNYLQWMFFFASTLERHIKSYNMLIRNLEKDNPALKKNRLELEKCSHYLEAHLGSHTFFLGNEPSVVDISGNYWLRCLQESGAIVKDGAVDHYLRKIEPGVTWIGS